MRDDETSEAELLNEWMCICTYDNGNDNEVGMPSEFEIDRFSLSYE